MPVLISDTDSELSSDEDNKAPVSRYSFKLAKSLTIVGDNHDTDAPSYASLSSSLFIKQAFNKTPTHTSLTNTTMTPATASPMSRQSRDVVKRESYDTEQNPRESFQVLHQTQLAWAPNPEQERASSWEDSALNGLKLWKNTKPLVNPLLGTSMSKSTPSQDDNTQKKRLSPSPSPSCNDDWLSAEKQRLSSPGSSPSSVELMSPANRKTLFATRGSAVLGVEMHRKL